MKDKTLRTLLAVAAVLLVLDQLFDWLNELWSAATGFIGVIVVVIVSVICGRLARSSPGNVAYFFVPTLLFTVIPLVAKVWKFFTEEKSLLSRLLEIAPFLFGFVLPLGLLLFIYYELSKREKIPAV
ncbi:MAG: hypothetical protein ACYTBZ_23000 [Planctomycetota bacterium]|jgi:hypothetical protein